MSFDADSSSRRFRLRYAADGGGSDKLLADIVGQSVLQRSVGLFASRIDVGLSRLSPPRNVLTPIVNICKALSVEGGSGRSSVPFFVAGTCERWESVLFGLRALAAEPDHAPHVAIHDAARPLAPASVIDEAFAAAMGGSIALRP